MELKEKERRITTQRAYHYKIEENRNILWYHFLITEKFHYFYIQKELSDRLKLFYSKNSHVPNNLKSEGYSYMRLCKVVFEVQIKRSPSVPGLE